MKRLTVSVFLIFILLVPVWSAQESNSQLSQNLADSRLKDLQECDTKLQQWQTWADQNISNYDRVRHDNDELTTENARLNRKLNSQSLVVMQWIFWCAAGLGAGALAMFTILKSAKRTWPLSTSKQQLFILVAGATWITVAAILCVFSSQYSDRPISLLAAVCLYSLPAILFSGIGYWWTGKDETKPKMGF